MTDNLKKESSRSPLRGVRGLFPETYFPLASLAGERFGINPVVILAQAALESGWGESVLSREGFNFFGLAAYSRPNEFWNGAFMELSEDSPRFRRYEDAEQGFLDYGRLLATFYPHLAALSYYPEMFAREVACGTTLSGIVTPKPPGPLKGGQGKCLELPEGARLYIREIRRIVDLIGAPENLRKQ